MLEKRCLNCGGPVLEDSPRVEMGDVDGYLCGESGNRCWQRLGEDAFTVVSAATEEALREAELYFESTRV